ncbi:MAG TPA: hypothetical protein VJ720_07395, partial [Chitinophaga sp.]|nr:hypothetical protein [Chitinophaga sp.]
MKSFIKYLPALLLFPAAFTGGCRQPVADKEHTREMFDAKGQHVITLFANRKQQTMSVLYGNKPAQASALSGYKQHVPGEVFTLVTYHQADSKYWYGSYINGAIKSVEQITATVSGEGYTLNYKLEQGG